MARFSAWAQGRQGAAPLSGPSDVGRAGAEQVERQLPPAAGLAGADDAAPGGRKPRPQGPLPAGFRAGQRVVATGQAWWDGDVESRGRRGAKGVVVGVDDPGHVWVRFDADPFGFDPGSPGRAGEEAAHCLHWRAIERLDEEEEREGGAEHPAKTAWAGWWPPEPPRCRPAELGTGVVYEVVGARAVNRAAPSLEATILGCKVQGKLVELFEWDETRRWRRHVDAITYVSGWMMLDHPELGPLLRPHGLRFQPAPLEPLCEAAREGDVAQLERFLASGSEVDVRGAGDRTPLMLAAAAGRGDACVLLVGARANATARGADDGMTALQLAADEPTRCLLGLLTGQAWDPVRLPAALAQLRPDIRLQVEAALQKQAAQAAAAAEAVQRAMRTATLAPLDAPAEADAAAAAAEALPALGVPPAPHEVVVGTCAIRSAPSMDAGAVGARRRGQVVDLCGYDASGAWRRLAPRALGDGRDGWMLLRHVQLGALLRPLHPEEDAWPPPPPSNALRIDSDSEASAAAEGAREEESAPFLSTLAFNTVCTYLVFICNSGGRRGSHLKKHNLI